MKAFLAAFVAALAIALTSARAMGAGVNLSWNDCGAHGDQLQTFACDTNVGTHTIVGSFVAPAGIVAVSANEVIMDLTSGEAALPGWWQLRTGLCRPASLSGNWDFTGGPFSCYDYWQGGAIGGIAMDPPQANRARIKMVFALPAGDARITSIAEGADVYSFKAVINNAKTTGVGACGGCNAGACIVLNQIKLNQPLPNGPIFITNPAERNFVTWQCPGTMVIIDPGIGTVCQLDCPTPARAKTWGQIKQLYR